MKIKHYIGIILIVCGLFIGLGSFGRKAPEEITKTVDDQEIVLQNTSKNHGNWQFFLGLAFLGLGAGIMSIPSEELIAKTR